MKVCQLSDRNFAWPDGMDELQGGGHLRRRESSGGSKLEDADPGTIEVQIVFGVPTSPWELILPDADPNDICAELVRYGPDAEQKQHYHTTTQVECMLEGELELTRASDGKTWTLKPGEIWVTDAYEQYRLRTPKHTGALWLACRPRAAEVFFPGRENAMPTFEEARANLEKSGRRATLVK